MNATVHTAIVLDQHRAITLDRENELLRRQAERGRVSTEHRPTGFAAVTDWILALVRRPYARLATH